MVDRFARLRRGALVACTVALPTLVLAGCAEDDQSSLDPTGEESTDILNLFRPFFWVAVVIGVGVVGGTIYAALRFRAKPGDDGNPKQVHGNTVLEIGWTIVPALILVVMAVPTISTIFSLSEDPDGEDVLHVNVIAKQWFFEYEYCDEGREQCGVALATEADADADDGVDFVTANELHLPVGRTVDFSISAPAEGVIHSFWIPPLNGKKDAVPGRQHFLKVTPTEEGEFLGQCTEYCGTAHADMRIRAFVTDEQEYEDWAARQRDMRANDANRQEILCGLVGEGTAEECGTDEDDAEKEVINWGCTACHSFGIQGADVRIGPSLAHVGDRTTLAAGKYDMSLENLTEWVWHAPERKPMGNLVAGIRMPNFQDEQGMTRDQAEEVARFLCSTATTEENEQRCVDGWDTDIGTDEE